MSDNVILIEENEDKTITTIKMNRLNKKNALNFDLMVGLLKAIDQVERTNARVVIITGGDEFFSSGIDLNFLTGQERDPEGVILIYGYLGILDILQILGSIQFIRKLKRWKSLLLLK